MNQAKKESPEEAERNEKVRQVLQAAGEPLGPIQIAERINERWCMWNGAGMGSAVTPVLRKIGARIKNGKWSLKEAPASQPEPGCVGDLGMVPPSVMSAARWERIRKAMEAQQK